MINDKLWINYCHGMELNTGFKEGIRGNENGILFLVQYYYLKSIRGILTDGDIATFNIICENLRTYNSMGTERYKGLFDRGAGESLTIPDEKLRTISHDNISAIVGFSYMHGLGFHKDVYRHGVANKWRFDNVFPEAPRSSRMMLPRDIIYWSRLGGSRAGRLLSMCFMWYFYLTQIITCIKVNDVRPQLHNRILKFFKTGKWPKPERITVATSGKLMAFTRLYPLTKKSIFARLTWWICRYLVESNFDEGFKSIFDIYYKNPDHPIRDLAEDIYDFNDFV